jgi:hypothetical protein
MKKKDKKNTTDKLPICNADNTGLDNDADKSGTDINSDTTNPNGAKKSKGVNKFDKPKREPNPDRTGIDIKSDKTKKENN